MYVGVCTGRYTGTSSIAKLDAVHQSVMYLLVSDMHPELQQSQKKCES